MKQIDALFISPHLDDAVYSCGGTIAKLVEQENNVTICTLFAGLPKEDELSPFAREIHQRWTEASPNPNETNYQTRRREDKEACTILGASRIQLDFLECIYRQENGRWLYPTEESLFDTLDEADKTLGEELAFAIEAIKGVDDSTNLYIPLALGQHIDHQLANRIAPYLNKFSDIKYYEDFPHSENTNELEAMEASTSWNRHKFELAENHIDFKIKAMAAHKSQITTFWENRKELSKQVKQHWVDKGHSEHFWQQKS